MVNEDQKEIEPSTPMKKIRIIFDVDVETGDFKIEYKNITYPGESIDYTFLVRIIAKIFNRITARFGVAGEA